MKLILKISLIGIVLLPSLLFAQKKEYILKNFNVDDGLLSSTVYCAVQDKDGYMWFGTEAGVNKFDGHRFQRFTLDDGLEDNEVPCIFPDSKNRLWFLGMNGKLCFYQDGKFYNSRNLSMLAKTRLKSNYVSAYEDLEGNLWFCSNNHGAVEITPDSIVNFYPNPEPFGIDFYLATHETRDGSLFLVGSSGYKRIKGKAVMEWPDSLKNRIKKFVAKDRSDLFIITDLGIYKISDTTFQHIYDFPPTIYWRDVTQIVRLKDGDLVLVTFKGTYLLQNKQNKYIPDVFYTGKPLLNVTEDHEENIWMTTAGSGVYLLPNKTERWEHFTRQDGLLNDPVYSILKDPTRGVWIGEMNGVLSKIENGKITRTIKLFDSKITYNRIRSLLLDRNNILWSGSDFGIMCFPLNQNGKSFKVPIQTLDKGAPNGSRINQINEYAVKCLNPDTSGNIYSTYFFGVIGPPLKDIHKNLVLSGDSARIGRRTYCHFFDSKNRLWVSDINGLYCEFSPGIRTQITSINSILRSRILCINEISDNRIILGCDGDGIIVLKDSTVQRTITIKDGLPSNVCRKIRITDQGWFVCTNTGLTQVKEENNSIRINKTFNIQTGLLSNDVYDMLLDNDTLWVGTGKGLSRTSISTPLSKTSPPPLLFESFAADGKAYDLHESISLNPGTHQVIIQFIAIAFQNPKKIQYSYALAETDTNWNSTTLNSVEYSDLHHGHYNFLVRAKREGENWGPVIRLPFEIQPAYYSTMGFKFFVLLIVLSLMYFLIRRITNYRLRRQLNIFKAREALEVERMRIATDMHDDIGSDLSKISILSNIVVSKKGTEYGTRQIERISALSSGLLKKLDEIIWALNPSHDHLIDFVSYLRAFCLETSENSPVQVIFLPEENLPDLDLSSAQRRSIFLIVKESVHNAIKHSGQSEVRVKLKLKSPFLYLTIEDSGIGLVPVTSDRKGLGMPSMQRRAEEIGGKLTVISEPGKGMRLELIIPLKQIVKNESNRRSDN